MFKNYLKVAWRRIMNQKGYAAINIIGLSLGMVCCLFIFLFVANELQYDRFHEEQQLIHRITTIEKDEGNERHLANSYMPVADLMKTGFPEIAQTVRCFPYSVAVKNPENEVLLQEEDFFFADSLFFELFSFPLLQGDPKTVLDAPNALVLTASAAQRFFGEEDPLGKSLLVDNAIHLTVSGIVADPPANSSIQFELIAAMPACGEILGDWMFSDRKTWYYPPVYTFAKFPDEATYRSVANRIEDFDQDHLSERLAAHYDFRLQPLTDIHFTALEGDLQPSVNPLLLFVLILVAILVLVIAGVNYINLSLADLLHRFREIGMRRVLGAAHRHLFYQLSTEALLFLTGSFILAVCLFQFGAPSLSNLVDQPLSLTADGNGWVLLGALPVLLILSAIGSAFLYLAIQRRKGFGQLKGEYTETPTRSGFSFKNAFIVFQFTIAVALIIATLVIQYQLNYIKHKDLGLQSEQLMIVPIRTEEVQADFTAVKDRFTKVPGIVSVSAISNFPWEKGYYDFTATLNGEGKSIEANLPTLLVEADFVQTVGLDLQQGRALSTDFGTDATAGFIVNQAVTEKYGIGQAADWQITMRGLNEGNDKEGRIVGVVRDFHLRSLHHPIEPLVLTIAPQPYFLDNFVVRLETTEVAQTIQALSALWGEVAPSHPFEFFFLDQAFDDLYRQEARLGTLFSYFSLLAILIACLGMFALTAILSKHRTKEIGIRKVLGASVTSIVGLLSKDFLRLVVIALVIASPVAWYAMRAWLEDFAYRAEIGWWIFALAGGLAIGIAFLTVSIQSIKAARANPVSSLRSE